MNDLYWYIGLKPGLLKLRIIIVWRELIKWWWGMVVRHGRLRWFGYLKHKIADDWVSACRNNYRVMGRQEDLGWMFEAGLGLKQVWTVNRDLWRDLIWGKCLSMAQFGRMRCFLNKWLMTMFNIMNFAHLKLVTEMDICCTTIFPNAPLSFTL